MENRSVFLNKRVLIVGDGVSGKGAFDALSGAAECEFFTEHFFDCPKTNFDFIVVSPGIRKEHKIFDFAYDNNIPIFGEIELGYKLYSGKIIAVTGTNGKTTVTSLIGEILKNDQKSVSVCGNIGVSFSRCARFDSSDFAAVEVSSFQLESVTEFKPHIACILNITPDHLDRHKDMKEYTEAKLRIALNQDKDDYLILSQDDIPLSALENFYPKSRVLYTSVRGKVPGAYLSNGKIFFFDEYICDRDVVRMQGEHNIQNALFAVCVSKLNNVKNKTIIQTLSQFLPPNHRIVNLGVKCGKCFYNDSKGTNIAATLKAAASMPSSACLILGGSDKGYEFDELFKRMPKNIVHIFALGETSGKIIDAAKRNNFFEIEKVNSLEEAVKLSAVLDVENVLLSPACASFDMFKNYAERGEVFERAVMELED